MRRLQKITALIISLTGGFFSGTSARAAPPDFTETYADAAHGFSFKYPPTLRIHASQQDATAIIVARNAAKTIGFQIHIKPIGGTDRAITPTRIARDMPGLAIRGPQRLRIPGAGLALAFYATEQNFGESFQVWFIRQGRLYQLSSYAPHDALVRGVLATWTFTK